MKIAQGDPEQVEGAALGTRSIIRLAPRRGAATSLALHGCSFANTRFRFRTIAIHSHLP
jgi:hypothetical protein